MSTSDVYRQKRTAKCENDKRVLPAKCTRSKKPYKPMILPKDQRFLKGVEVCHESSEKEARFSSIVLVAPAGFHDLMEKMVRAVILGRPVNIYLFFANFLEAELDKCILFHLLNNTLKEKPYFEDHRGDGPTLRMFTVFKDQELDQELTASSDDQCFIGDKHDPQAIVGFDDYDLEVIDHGVDRNADDPDFNKEDYDDLDVEDATGEVPSPHDCRLCNPIVYNGPFLFEVPEVPPEYSGPFIDIIDHEDSQTFFDD